MWDRFRGAVPQKHGRQHAHQQQPQQHQQYAQQQQQYLQASSQYQPRAQQAAGYSYTIQGGPPPPRPPREFMEQQQQMQNHYHSEAPVQQQHLQPQQRNPNRDSGLRPASSVYSQPSPIQTNFAPPPQKRNYTFSDSDEISPPSSPEPFSPRDGQHEDISPIEEEPHDMMPQQTGLGGGHIPSMRRERRHKMDAAANQLRESKSRDRLHTDRRYHGGEVRWDPATGELTSSEKGRPSQVKPAEYVKDLATTPERPQPGPEDLQPATQRNVSASFGERLRKIAPPGFATGGQERKVSQPRQTQFSPSATDPAANAFSADRPGWKGASGRAAIVEPVRDVRDVTPLNIPRKSSKRAGAKSPTIAGPANGAVGASRMDTVLASPPVSPIGNETRETIRQIVPSSQVTPVPPPHQDPAADYPSPPYSGGSIPPPLSVQTSAADDKHSAPAPPPHLVQSPASLTPTSGIRRKPAPAQSYNPHESFSSSVHSIDPYNYNYTHNQHGGPSSPSANPQLAVSPPQEDAWTQPPSRFSVSTYATTAHETPRPSTDGFDYSSAPPLPPLPSSMDPTAGQDAESEATNQESVMDRRRPKLRGPGGGSPIGSSGSSDGEPIVVSIKDGGNWRSGNAKKAMSTDQATMRKPVGHGLLGSGRPESITSMSGSIYKSLPLPPPESSAKDRADQLNAQLRGLANRRINIDRSIKQMTELMPTDNIMASAEVLRKREMERNKVEALRSEMSEVQREEYELGLKLHRVYKRMDREASYEPNTLWVRRVTG